MSQPVRNLLAWQKQKASEWEAEGHKKERAAAAASVPSFEEYSRNEEKILRALVETEKLERRLGRWRALRDHAGDPDPAHAALEEMRRARQPIKGLEEPPPAPAPVVPAPPAEPPTLGPLPISKRELAMVRDDLDTCVELVQKTRGPDLSDRGRREQILKALRAALAKIPPPLPASGAAQ